MSVGQPALKVVDVFLGGACGDTTWRKDIAIPVLESAGVSFYNPQLGPGEWTPELIPVEAAAKLTARCQLFVITAETRGVASMIEVAELIASKRSTALCIEAYTGEGEDASDVNRGRVFLHDVAQRHGCFVHESIEEAAREAVRLVEGARTRSGPKFGNGISSGFLHASALAVLGSLTTGYILWHWCLSNIIA